MVTMHYRKMTVRGENIRIGDVLPSGAVVDLITIDNNAQRVINGVRYQNDKLVPIIREVSSEGLFGNTNAKGHIRANWEDRIFELYWLVDGGVHPLKAIRQIAADNNARSWLQNLKGPEHKAMRERIRTAMKEE